jgi:cellulose synthase/poly-beta-1,6-N-acetylglucosamine synthase-like glycosyltransferase
LVTALLSVATFAAGTILSVPAIIYAAETLAGSVPLRRRLPVQSADRRSVVAVLVPAHNEEDGLAVTLASIGGQLREQDRLVVVADNCTDGTAALARAAGAEVVERFDPERRGKGFALDAGIRYLEKSPPDIVLLVDADCHLGPGALESLAAAVAESGRPVQARNLMTAPAGGALNYAVAEFAFLVKNHVRPLGLARLGLPCQITGTGSAIPWRVLRDAHVAHAGRVEDMKLGLDLAAAGHPPRFCEHALVASQFPCSTEGAISQRRRWEGGHLELIRKEMRSLLDPSSFRNLPRLALTLDLMVPPLTLLLVLMASCVAVAGLLALANLSVWPLAIAAANLFLVLLATAVAWLVHGRNALPVRALGVVPFYLLWKMRLWPGTLFGSGRDGWIRTDRTKSVVSKN